MYIEKSLKEALEDYILGRPVTVLWTGNDGGMNAMRLSDLLEEEENHYLVNVPAVANPEFERAVQEMEESAQPEPEEIIQAVHDTQEEPEDCPPPETETAETELEEETVDLPADNIEDKKEKIRKLVEEGYTNREIADRTGIPFGTVGYHAARFRKKEKEPAVDNSDRHLCKTCKFRSNRPTVNSCDYAGLMKHSRGCKVEECTKYEKGARMKMKDVEE